MIIVKTILIYILAVPIVGSLAGVVPYLLGFSLRPLIAKDKWLQPILVAFFNVVGNFLAVFIISLLCKLFSVKSNVLMIVIPFIYTMIEGNNRIERAKAGKSSVIQMFERSNKLEEYNRQQEIRIERAYLIGDIIGLLLGSLYFLRS